MQDTTEAEEWLNYINQTLNSTYLNDTANFIDISSWSLMVYIGNVGTGTLLNIFAFIAIFMADERNGILTIVLQLCLADVLSSWVCVTEIWCLKNKNWIFPSELCPLFSGTEIFTNCLTVYLIITLNFHTLSLNNLKYFSALNPLTSCDASNECLVRDSRQLNPDYKQRQKDISVLIPCILIWFISLSLSIPQFTLSSTLKDYENNTTMCTVVDIYCGKLLQNLLTLFRVIIPVVLISLTVLVLVYRLYENLFKDAVQNIFMKKSHNILYYIIFCLAINLLFFFTSLQRLILYSLHTFNMNLEGNETYKIPPFFNNCLNQYVNLLLSMLHYSGTFFRFPVYLFLLPTFKALLCNNILICFKNN